MRGLKFRAYFNYQMSHPFTLGEAVCWPGGKVRTGSRVGKIMQYTGIKDKNGVEVYEGDILLCPDFDGYEDWCCDANAVIEYSTPKMQWVATAEGVSKDANAWVYDELTTEFEVIGNIYENPELLNNKSK
jgi:hypothetical protein